MKELVLVVDQNYHGELPPDSLVVHWEQRQVPAGHLSLPVELEKNLEEIRKEHARWAYEMGRQPGLGGDMQSNLKAGESLSMWWCSLLYERHPKMTPHLYSIYKLRVLEKLLYAGNYNALRVYGGSGRMRQTLAEFCNATRRCFVESHSPLYELNPQCLLTRIYHAMPAPLRAASRFVHWWLNIRRKLPYNATMPAVQTEHKAASIVTYFPNVDMQAAQEGRFRSRYWESLHDRLNATAEKEGGPFVRWLFIRFPAPQLDLDQCIDLRERFRREQKDGLSFHYLEEMLSWRDLCAAWWRFLRLCWTSWRLQRKVRLSFHLPGSRLNLCYYIQDDWAESFRGWRCLERCIQNRGLQRFVAAAGPVRWTLFPLENCPWERMLTQAVHDADNGPVYGAQHSSLRPADFRYFDDPNTFSDAECLRFQPDLICGNGSSALKQWMDADVPAEKLGEVEALRYLYLAGTERFTQVSHASACKRILIFTSFFEDDTRAHLRLLADAIKHNLLQDREIIIKPHPYQPVEEILRELLGAEASAVQVVDTPLAELWQPDTLVWTSNSTTTALEAALKGLPLMVMSPYMDFDLCPIQDVEGLTRTATLEDVRRGLKEATPLHIEAGYLNLDAALPRWKELLHLQ